MHNLLDDIATVTTAPRRSLQVMSERAESCIGHSLWEAVQQGKHSCEIFMGVGTLVIEWETSEELIVRFIPSSSLKDTMSEVVNHNIDPLEQVLEKSIVSRIQDIYKELT